ncbi:hypothetical protein [Aquabacter spiritensis]|uniref:Periplasmic protein n=1 Tax=Aquabacter spiritensis TaxID=933073 RepID=A0A4R3LVK1_9HYPH|nr:hypothetical protein [Aquabacter spiritensis]TCT02715.1 hypothetical protein EDC64_112154 [Aquabacter spiritensis]
MPVPTLRATLKNWRTRPDDAILSLVFAGLLALTGAMLAQDGARFAREAGLTPATFSNLPGMIPDFEGPNPDLPDTDPGSGPEMTFELRADGRLYATGSILPGAAKALAAELEKRGGYVRTVVLDSPGGAVQEALAMGRMIRDKGYATEVPDNGRCASSCPLVFAGGVERRAGRDAALGVHQVYAAAQPSGRDLPESMARAQRISAACQRHLRDMGVDLEVWVHAMETPREKLFFFSPEEMRRLKLTTG